MCFFLETFRAIAALAKGLQRCQTLNGIEELRRKCFVITPPLERFFAVPVVKHLRRDQRKKSGGQHHQRDRHIKYSHNPKNQERRENRNNQLRQILSKIDLELFDTFDHRHNGVPRALKPEVSRAQTSHLIKNHGPKMQLHNRCRIVGHHRAPVLKPAPNHHHNRDADERDHQLGKSCTRKNLGNQPAQKGKTGNPEKHAQHTKRDGPQNAKPDAPGKAPES